MKCNWCDEEVLPGEEPKELIHGGHFHIECALRCIAGSVGHINKRCSCYGGTEDDDPNLSKRDQARAAQQAFVDRENPNITTITE